ncbi:hypothetical protein OTU49_011464, partial [Cherax quadricarinatus]
MDPHKMGGGMNQPPPAHNMPGPPQHPAAQHPPTMGQTMPPRPMQTGYPMQPRPAHTGAPGSMAPKPTGTPGHMAPKPQTPPGNISPKPVVPTTTTTTTNVQQVQPKLQMPVHPTAQLKPNPPVSTTANMAQMPKPTPALVPVTSATSISKSTTQV